MKKSLLFINNNEKGLILPSVLFLTTIVLLYFSSSLMTYSHDVHLTYNMMEQVKSQSLFQMAYTQYKRDHLSHTIKDDLVKYQYPNGDVQIKATQGIGMVQLEFIILTNNSFSSNVTKLSKLPPVKE